MLVVCIIDLESQLRSAQMMVIVGSFNVLLKSGARKHLLGVLLGLLLSLSANELSVHLHVVLLGVLSVEGGPVLVNRHVEEGAAVVLEIVLVQVHVVLAIFTEILLPLTHRSVVLLRIVMKLAFEVLNPEVLHFDDTLAFKRSVCLDFLKVISKIGQMWVASPLHNLIGADRVEPWDALQVANRVNFALILSGVVVLNVFETLIFDV